MPADRPGHRAARGRASRRGARAAACAPTRASRAVQAERRARPRLVPNDPALADARDRRPARARHDRRSGGRSAAGFLEAWDIVAGRGATVAVDRHRASTAPIPSSPAGSRGLRRRFDAARAARGPDDESATARTSPRWPAAAGDNGVGIAGAGLELRLLVAKTDFTDSSVAAAIVGAADRGADAINLSFGTDGAAPSAARASSTRSSTRVARGVVLVAAAADDPTEEQGDPANILQPTGTGPDLDAGPRALRHRRDFSDRARAVRRPRRRRSRSPRTAPSSASDGPRGLFGAFRGRGHAFERGELGRRRAAVRLPHDLRRRPALRLPAGHVDGDARSSAASPRSCATEPGPAARRGRAAAQGDAPGAPAARGWNPELGWGILDAGAAVAAARGATERPPTLRASRTAAAPAARDARLRVRLHASRTSRRRGVDAGGVRSVEISCASTAGAARSWRIVAPGRAPLRPCARRAGAATTS